MSVARDETGNVYGTWTAIRRVENDKSGPTMWLCRCACGTEKIVNIALLRRGHSKSCGCSRVKDLKGKTFGKLKVLEHVGVIKSKTTWRCSCACGNEVLRAGYDMLKGRIKSCGCGKNDPRPSIRGAKHGRWRGGRHKMSTGYIRVYNPEAFEQPEAYRYKFEHILVMEQSLGRPLHPGETVHHKNGIRDDNRSENLELWASAHPMGQRIDDLVENALVILRRYAPHELSSRAGSQTLLKQDGGIA